MTCTAIKKDLEELKRDYRHSGKEYPSLENSREYVLAVAFRSTTTVLQIFLPSEVSKKVMVFHSLIWSPRTSAL